MHEPRGGPVRDETVTTRRTDEPSKRAAPTLIHDGKAWVEACHYDEAIEALVDAAVEAAATQGPVTFSAEELHCLICAMAGNFPEQFGPIRMGLLRKLTK